MYEELAIRIEMFGDEIEKLTTLHPLTGEIIRDEEEIFIFPATHYAAAHFFQSLRLHVNGPFDPHTLVAFQGRRCTKL